MFQKSKSCERRGFVTSCDQSLRVQGKHLRAAAHMASDLCLVLPAAISDPLGFPPSFVPHKEMRFCPSNPSGLINQSPLGCFLLIMVILLSLGGKGQDAKGMVS